MEKLKMERLKLMILPLLLSIFIASCSTTGTFKIPDGSELYIYKRTAPVYLAANGKATVKPFFWSAAGIPPRGGAPYRLEKNGEVIKKGRLRVKFRIVSIFWPPFAIIYWPFGLNPNITYDLVNGTQGKYSQPSNSISKNEDNVIEKIRALQELKEDGVLTEEEFQKKKTELLDKM